MSSVRDLVGKLKHYYQANNPHDLTALNPPATDKDIKAIEKSLPGIMRLPKEYVEFLKMHNGATTSQQGAKLAHFTFGPWTPLTIDRVLSTLKVMNDLLEDGDFDHRKIDKPTSGVKSVWWNPKWLPVFSNGRGNYLCIDFDPAPGGKIAQIIEYDRDFGERAKRYASFLDMLDALVHEHIDEAESYKSRKQEESHAPAPKAPSWLSWIIG